MKTPTQWLNEIACTGPASGETIAAIQTDARASETSRADKAEAERDKLSLDNIAYGYAIQTLRWNMGLDNTKEDLRECLLTYEAVKSERDKALAACAEMREALTRCPHDHETDPRKIPGLLIPRTNCCPRCLADKITCGQGWVSPEDYRERIDIATKSHLQTIQELEAIQKQVKTLVEALELAENGQLSQMAARKALSAVKAKA